MARASFQDRVAEWVLRCVGSKLACDELERQDRFLEEVLEALQARGYDLGRVSKIARYVYSRPVGEIRQEIGGIMTTLAAWCKVLGFDMVEAAEAELSRAEGKVEEIRAKSESKPRFLPEKPDDNGWRDVKTQRRVNGHEGVEYREVEVVSEVTEAEVDRAYDLVSLWRPGWCTRPELTKILEAAREAREGVTVPVVVRRDEMAS